jgi:glucose-6-phosphate 1-epimerase
LGGEHWLQSKENDIGLTTVIQDISQVAVSGLEGTTYKDQTQGGKTMNGESGAITIAGEVDRLYSSDSAQPIVVAEKNKPKYEITQDLMSDVVVWNPWVEKAKGIADLGPEDGYKKMICVEAGSVATWNTLEAGDTWEGGQRIRML